MMEPETRRIEVTIAAPLDDVWRALRDPALIRRWHGWEDDGLDEEVRAIYVNGMTADDDAHVLVVDGGDRFTLHPVTGGTLVRITRAPLGDNPEWDAYYDEITEGWATFLQQLRFGIERHGLAERRTVIVHGRLPVAAAEAPTAQAAIAEAATVEAATAEAVAVPETGMLAVLGLAEAARLPVGARYKAVVPTGDTLTGEVYACGEHQHVFTVDEFGDGLFIVSDLPVSPQHPEGAAKVYVTAYGVGEAEFADFARRLTAWWESVRAH
jgi:hypothetical protein